MIFYGNPNETVSTRVKQNGEFRNKLLFVFNENGEYETEDEKLIKKLKQHFKYKDEIKKHCKKCDFTCDN